jgi:Rad3-related DNA helicase
MVASLNIQSKLDSQKKLANSINRKIPDDGTPDCALVRSELAGLLVVSTVAKYERCVFDIIHHYTDNIDQRFSYYAIDRYDRLNSRIKIDDLCKLLRLFDEKKKKKKFLTLKGAEEKRAKRDGYNINTAYNQMLSWRHEYAHRGVTSATIKDILDHHQHAQRIIQCFKKSLL